MQIPLTVFAMRDGLGDVTIRVETEGPLATGEKHNWIVSMPESGETDIEIPLNVDQAIGQAVIRITARAGDVLANSRTDISIVPVSPEISEWSTQPIKPGQEIAVTIPDKGLPGSNQVELRVSKRAGLNINHRIQWLIRYPYGCVEQTTSAALPQLYLKKLTQLSPDQEARIDRNVNRAIEKLRRFQVPVGGFSYWPGHHNAQYWCSTYVGRFLLEAERFGYFVPANMKERWLQFEREAASGAEGSLSERCYRLYLLALAGTPETGPMNLLKENSLKSLSTTNRWLLAAAYHLAGSPDIAEEIIADPDMNVPDYRETGGTYGSAFRDRAILLELTTTMENWDLATPLFARIAERLSRKTWLSTQEGAYALAALAHYILATDDENTALMGEFQLADGSRHPFKTTDLMTSIPVPEGSGKTGNGCLVRPM